VLHGRANFEEFPSDCWSGRFKEASITRDNCAISPPDKAVRCIGAGDTYGATWNQP